MEQRELQDVYAGSTSDDEILVLPPKRTLTEIMSGWTVLQQSDSSDELTFEY